MSGANLNQQKPGSEVSQRTVSREISAGLTLLLSMLFIIAVLPALFAQSGYPDLAVRTAFVCALGTLIFGLFCQLPYGVGPGIVPAMIFLSLFKSGIPYSTVLAIGFFAGILFLGLALSGLLAKFVILLPQEVKVSISFAVGLFLFVSALDIAGLFSLFKVQHGGQNKIGVLLFLLGLIIAFGFYRQARIRHYAILFSMLLVTIAASLLGMTALPAAFLSIPQLPNFAEMDLASGLNLKYLSPILSLLYVIVVDVIVTLQVCAQFSSGELSISGQPKNFQRFLITSGAFAILGPVYAMPPLIIFFESAGAVLSGGRTWRVSLVTGLGFLMLMFCMPLIAIVPSFASAVALAFIGFSILRHAYAETQTDWISRGLTLVAVVGAVFFRSISISLLAICLFYLLLKLLIKGLPTCTVFDWTSGALALILLVMSSF